MTGNPKMKKGQRGQSLMMMLLIGILIVSTLAAIYGIKLERKIKEAEIAKRQAKTVLCKKAIKEVVDTLAIEKKISGKYPRDFNEKFLDRYKMIDRYIFNSEIWSPDAGGELWIETHFGDYYELTGWCRDGNVFYFDSEEKKLFSRRYGKKDIEEAIEQ